jgi:hypothetical protein
MELIGFIAILLAFNLLAARFACDSRIPADSEEYELALHGMTWS